jgi:hypothetical protein
MDSVQARVTLHDMAITHTIDVLIIGAGHAGLAMSGLMTARVVSTWWSSVGTLWAEAGRTAGTRSAWSRRTGPHRFPGGRTTAPIPTGS